eukprot:gb/GECG01001824.1/.p1 GENE.gb/GECG01001824.1/~~gb/GECG01001824.1/.p1  ORF type:complete len:117 (+),score=4.05 gb/GECG01001824.1/:1-351(+)
MKCISHRIAFPDTSIINQSRQVISEHNAANASDSLDHEENRHQALLMHWTKDLQCQTNQRHIVSADAFMLECGWFQKSCRLVNAAKWWNTVTTLSLNGAPSLLLTRAACVLGMGKL